MCKVTSRLSPRTIFSLLVLIAVLSVARCACGQSDKDLAARAQATALFAKALSVSDLRAPGSPPFEMRATINIEQSRHKPPIQGTYLLEWASPEKWREEIHLPNYARIRVGGKNQYWQLRNPFYEIQPVLELDYALDFLKGLHVWSEPGAIAGLGGFKLHQAKVERIKSDCVTLIRKGQQGGGDYCFDPVKGVLVLYRPSTEFSEFTSFAGKLFPGNIRVTQESAAPIAFVVNSISALASAAPTDFQPADGSTSWPSCHDPDALPNGIQMPAPVYPMAERHAGVEGTVFVYAVIGTDGLLHNLQVLSAPESGLANAALAALAQWRYTPETCQGTPVPVETLLKIVFVLA